MRSVGKRILWVVLAVAGVGVAFTYAQVGIAIDSIRFDLRSIGASVYQAHARTGRWPETIADLDGTEYLLMPYRRGVLEDRLFVVVWPRDLDPNPERNPSRILAYDHGSLLSRLGIVYVCRGDLRTERVAGDELRELQNRSQ